MYTLKSHAENWNSLWPTKKRAKFCVCIKKNHIYRLTINHVDINRPVLRSLIMVMRVLTWILHLLLLTFWQRYPLWHRSQYECVKKAMQGFKNFLSKKAHRAHLLSTKLLHKVLHRKLRDSALCRLTVCLNKFRIRAGGVQGDQIHSSILVCFKICLGILKMWILSKSNESQILVLRVQGC